MRAERHSYTTAERHRPLFRRSADGRLRPATEEADVADVWAERERARLAEVIAAEKLRAAKRARRKERGMLGLRAKRAAVAAEKKAADTPREIAIQITVPKIDVAEKLRGLRRRIPALSKKQWVWVGIGAALLLFIVGTQGVYNQTSKPTAQKAGIGAGSQAVAGAHTTPTGGTQPDYPTVLPPGKTIQQLGGWGRISPADKNAVFAYSDSLAGVHIVVSEQPLPDKFKGDLQNQLSQLAQQFGSPQKLTAVDGNPVFISTTATGLQAVVGAKTNVLVLVRSSSNISNQLLADYIGALQ